MLPSGWSRLETIPVSMGSAPKPKTIGERWSDNDVDAGASASIGAKPNLQAWSSLVCSSASVKRVPFGCGRDCPDGRPPVAEGPQGDAAAHGRGSERQDLARTMVFDLADRSLAVVHGHGAGFL